MEKSYISNDLNCLYEKLKEELFADKSFSLHRTIVVPSNHTKSYLLQKFASDPSFEGIMLLDFIEIKNIFSLLLEFFDPEAKFPSILELQLVIEAKLKKTIERNLKKSGDRSDEKTVAFDGNESSDISILFRYLNIKGEDFSKKQKRRLSLISSQLANLFYTYAVFEKELALEEKKGNLWQKDLWKEVFDDFVYPGKVLSKPPRGEAIRRRQIHLFNLSFMPNVYRQSLQILPFPVVHYLLSPCKYFWEDACSDREKRFFLKNAKKRGQDFEDIDTYLSDTNPLLANLGKIKREYLKILDSHEMESTDFYKNSEEDYLEKNSFEKFSLLQALRQDILNLRNIEETGPYLIRKENSSLQLHEASSKIREVEILYDYILSYLSSDKELTFSDIKIYAPDIKEYLPYIHLIFKGSSELGDYKIFDLDNIRNSFFSQGVGQFFSLMLSRWEKSDVFDLFENPSFMKKHGFSTKDMIKLKRWMDKANVSWGINSEQRQKILCEPISGLHLKSWEHGFERVISSFIFCHDNEDNLPFLPIEDINFSEAELFDKFLSLFFDLKRELEYLEQEKELDLLSWVSFIKKIIEKYFYVDDTKSEEGQSFLLLCNFTDTLFHLGKKYPDQKYAISSILKGLDQTLKKESSTFNSSSSTGLSFYSLKEDILPAKVLCFIGLDEEFPRKDRELSFSYLEDKKKYIPQRSDIDRNFFLDLLLLAEEKAYLSYVGTCPYDGRKKMASCLVQEFLFYIDRAFSIEGDKISSYIFFSHPVLGFDESYFRKSQSDFFPISPLRYKAACKYYSSEGSLFEESPYFFIKDLKEKPDFNGGLLNLPETLDLKTLSALSSNPIKFYLNQVLQIYLDREKEKEYLKDFSLSFLDHYLIRNSLLTKSVDSILDKMEKEGDLPFGIYKEIAKEKIKEQSSIYFDHLANFQINTQDIKNIEFDSSLFFPNTKEEDVISLPSLEISIKEKKIKIIGRLCNISPFGLILFSDDKLENVLKVWPEFLIFLKIRNSIFKESSPSLIFLKNGKRKTFENIDVDYFLSSYLEYFGVCATNLSPLIPEWSHSLLLDDEVGFDKAVKRSFTEKKVFEDPYFKWAFSRFENRVAPRMIYKNWSSYLRNTYQAVLGAEGKRL